MTSTGTAFHGLTFHESRAIIPDRGVAGDPARIKVAKLLTPERASLP
jgi:hypothetical protein